MKNKLLASLICAAMLLAALPAVYAQADFKSNYKDVAGKWYAAAVAEYGYPEVFSDGRGSFYADRAVTRMEFARILHRALNIQISEEFRPSEPLSREEMIHWIINALNHKTGGMYPVPLMMPAPFGDQAQITEAYDGDIVTAVLLKLINGRGDNLLFPKAGATRAEAVTVVYRLMALLAGYGSDVDVQASATWIKDGSIAMFLTIHNRTDEPVLINHTSGQHQDFKLFDAKGNNIYTWSADKMFIAALTQTVIEAGEEIVLSDMVDGGTNDLIRTAVSMKAYIVGTSENFTVETEGYEVIIRR